MPELEAELTALADAIDWPSTPAPSWAGAGRSPVEPRAWPRWQSRWPLAAAAVLLIVAGLLAYTPARDAIASWVNVHTIFHRTASPPPPATPTSLPPGPPGQYLNLGERTTLAEGEARLGWKIEVPASLGPPDAVYVKLAPSGPSGGMVTLAYGPRPDIKTTRLSGVSVLVTEVHGRVDEQYFGKTLGPDVTIEDVSVDGHAGYWISGSPHMFVFIDTEGNAYPDTLRLATNTLVFDDGGTIVRVEGDLTKEQAIQIARSLA
jgi:hypothetical protein